MNLSRDLAFKFAKVTRNTEDANKEVTVYGTIKEQNGTKYVLLDGAEILTPIITTVDFEDGERVTVLLKNHTATVTGNITSPASRYSTVKDLEQKVKESATLITNMKIYQGTTNPSNPIKGETLWIDMTSDPPVLKQYTTEGKWKVVGTNALKTSYIAIQNDQIDINSGGKINIKSGGAFTVDAANLDINEDGVISAKKAELKDATVNGTLLSNGYPVLHSGNIVISSSEPSNPTVGMVWIKPDSATQIEKYIPPFDNDPYLQGENVIGKFQGDAISLSTSGTYTYKIKVPIYSYVSNSTYYIRSIVSSGNALYIFPTQEYSSSGLIWYDQNISGTFTSGSWIGSLSDLYLTIEISSTGSFSSSDLSSTPSDIFVYPVGYMATLEAIFVPESVSGWQNTSVKYFVG